MGKATDAVAWLCADDERTQVQAAMQFGITQGAVSAQKTREDYAISWCVQHPGEVEKACVELSVNPAAGPRMLAHKCGISEAEARQLLLGVEAQDARNKALRDKPAKLDPVAEMREKCAMLAESIGGEHGVHVAAAIRGLV